MTGAFLEGQCLLLKEERTSSFDADMSANDPGRLDTGAIMLQQRKRLLFVFHIAQIDLDQTRVSTPALSRQMFLGFNQVKGLLEEIS